MFLKYDSPVFQVCVWALEGWEKKTNRFLHIPTGRGSNPHGQTRVQFHQDQIHMLIVHETQLAIYEASKLDCVKQVQEGRHHCLKTLLYLVRNSHNCLIL